MRTLIPYPHVLSIMPATAATGYWKLTARTQPRAILPTTGLSLRPRRAVQTAAHAHVGAAAYAERRVECPAKLRTAELRCLLEWSRRW